MERFQYTPFYCRVKSGYLERTLCIYACTPSVVIHTLSAKVVLAIYDIPMRPALFNVLLDISVPRARSIAVAAAKAARLAARFADVAHAQRHKLWHAHVSLERAAAERLYNVGV